MLFLVNDGMKKIGNIFEWTLDILQNMLDAELTRSVFHWVEK